MLFHVLLLALVIIDWKRTPPPEPPVMTVELVQEEPPKTPEIEEQKKPKPPPTPPAPPQNRESGGDPDKAVGRPAEVDKPAQAKQSDEDQPIPAAATPDRKPEVALAPEHKAEPKAKKAPSPTKPPEQHAATQQAPVTLSDETGEGGGDRYLNTIRDLIKAKRVYPAVASALKLEGIARFEMDINRSGNLVGMRLMTSTGVGTLDQEGAEAIRNAAPFPPVPDEIPGETVRLFLAIYLGPRDL